MQQLRTIAAVLVIGLSTPILVFGQSETPDPEPGWEMPRLADGQPDLQGYWTTQTFTPMERPEYLGDKAFYTDEEWALLQSQLTVEGADPLAPVRHRDRGSRGAGPRAAAGASGRDLRPLRQLHLAENGGPQGAVDPPHLAGHRPAQRSDSSAQCEGPGPGGGPTGRPGWSWSVRRLRAASAQRALHLLWLQRSTVAATLPTTTSIRSSRRTDHVAIATEQNNSPPRIVPMDGRPPVSEKIRQYPGDSRGYGGTVTRSSSRAATSTTRRPGRGRAGT